MCPGLAALPVVRSGFSPSTAKSLRQALCHAGVKPLYILQYMSSRCLPKCGHSRWSRRTMGPGPRLCSAHHARRTCSFSFCPTATLHPDGYYRAAKQSRRVFGARPSHKTRLRQTPPGLYCRPPRVTRPADVVRDESAHPFANLRGWAELELDNRGSRQSTAYCSLYRLG